MPAGRFAPKTTRVHNTPAAGLGTIDPERACPYRRAPSTSASSVAGGPGTHSLYVPTFGQTRAAARAIAE